jgi:hypothetical protein
MTQPSGQKMSEFQVVSMLDGAISESLKVSKTGSVLLKLKLFIKVCRLILWNYQQIDSSFVPVALYVEQGKMNLLDLDKKLHKEVSIVGIDEFIKNVWPNFKVSNTPGIIHWNDIIKTEKFINKAENDILKK